jgi:tRNA U38,U39,U40 pseudouridine synthase TruA
VRAWGGQSEAGQGAPAAAATCQPGHCTLQLCCVCWRHGMLAGCGNTLEGVRPDMGTPCCHTQDADEQSAASCCRWHVPEPLNLEAMRAGAAMLQGTHDFTQFCNDNADRTRRNPVKTLRSVEVRPGLVPARTALWQAGCGMSVCSMYHVFMYCAVRCVGCVLEACGAMCCQAVSQAKCTAAAAALSSCCRVAQVVEVPGGLCIQVHGSGFLYRMVRHLAGSLVAVGQGRLPLDNIALRLELGDSCAPGEGGVWRGYNVAPAKGLVLQQVEYPAEVDDPGVWLYPELPHNEWGQCLVRTLGAGGEH